VTIFEKRDLPGGLNTFGVAEYKMDRRTSLEELRLLFRLGCSVVTNREVGADIAPKKLLADFNAVFLGVGLARTRDLGIPGEDLRGVVDALSFIERVKAGQARGGGRVVVIGGGNTAIDAATQSVRTGAEHVTLAYRRQRRDMPAYDFEVALAKTDGVSLLMNARPQRVLGKGKVEAVEFLSPEGLFTLACDRVIKAIGQEKEKTLPQAFGARLNGDGTIAVDPDTMRTSRRRVFAGGDAVNGGKEVVNAAADGKRAAWAIHRALRPRAAAPEGSAYWIKTL
ncbi:MAG: FAD-dependent oxidoreductase, partial [Elusimicrobiota bacterium]